MKLAYFYNPWSEGEIYRECTKEDLMKPEVVKELFDNCQIPTAVLRRAGWEFLIAHYGWEKLYEIDKESNWLSADADGSLENYILIVEEEMEFSDMAAKMAEEMAAEDDFL